MEGEGSRGARWVDAVDATTCPFILEGYRQCYTRDGELVLRMEMERAKAPPAATREWL